MEKLSHPISLHFRLLSTTQNIFQRAHFHKSSHFELTLHSALELNMNVCLFLQTFSAIFESEYLKLASVCYFFLISMICFQDIAILSYLSPYFNLC